MSKPILIIGGYGEVGSRIAARLVGKGIGPIRIAGRNLDKARATALALGCDSAAIDLGDPGTWGEALADVGTVVACVDQNKADFVAFVLGQGLDYVDVTADDTFFRKVEALDAPAGRAILSVGLAPGLTNLLAAAGAQGMDSVASIRIGVLLGLGDLHGPAAIDWTLRNLKAASTETVEIMDFGIPPRPHPAIAFDFADQHVLRRTLGPADIRTVLTFDSALMSRLFFALLRPLAASPLLQRLLKAAMLRLRFGSDRTALAVEVVGQIGNGSVARRIVLEGCKEAEITALIAALAVEHLLAGNVSPGVHHLHQIIALDAWETALASEGVEVTRALGACP